MRVRCLAALVFVGLVACGRETTQSVSSQQGAPDSRRGPATAPAVAGVVDEATILTRWRVVKTTPDAVLFRIGEVVEFRPGGAIAAGPELAPSPVTWTLERNRLELRTPVDSVSYPLTIKDDVLRLVDTRGKTHVLRRYLGPPGPLPAASRALDQARFVSLLASGRVESASLAQIGGEVTVTGVYLGERIAERYVVTLDDCTVIQSLGTVFRTKGVLTDGLPPSEVEC